MLPLVPWGALGRIVTMFEMCLGYLDPGSGSILLQLVMGALVGMGLFFRGTVMRALRFLRPGKSSSTSRAAIATKDSARD